MFSLNRFAGMTLMCGLVMQASASPASACWFCPWWGWHAPAPAYPTYYGGPAYSAPASPCGPGGCSSTSYYGPSVGCCDPCSTCGGSPCSTGSPCASGDCSTNYSYPSDEVEDDTPPTYSPPAGGADDATDGGGTQPTYRQPIDDDFQPVMPRERGTEDSRSTIPSEADEDDGGDAIPFRRPAPSEPSGGSTIPGGGGSTIPGGGSTIPGGGSTIPGGNSTIPGSGGSTIPGGNSTIPPSSVPGESTTPGSNPFPLDGSNPFPGDAPRGPATDVTPLGLEAPVAASEYNPVRQRVVVGARYRLPSVVRVRVAPVERDVRVVQK